MNSEYVRCEKQESNWALVKTYMNITIPSIIAMSIGSL